MTLASSPNFPVAKRFARPSRRMVPLSARKVGFGVRRIAKAAGTSESLELTLQQKTGTDNEQKWHDLDETKVSFRVRQPTQAQIRTFRSSIDGSVQYFGFLPASRPSRRESTQAWFSRCTAQE